jgi:hypothetical protein
MAELMRLRIPKGWIVFENKLHDVDPTTEKSSGLITNSHEGFTEDVLWIQEYRINDNGHYEIPETYFYSIDLSWRPDGDENGQYYAKLNWCSFDGLYDIELFESKNRFEIRDKIEFWMNDITENYFERHRE